MVELQSRRWGKVAYLKNELMIDESLGYVCIEVLALDEAEKELINNLNVRPCNLQHWFVLLRIKSFALRIHRGRYWAEQVFAEHVDDPGIHLLRYDLTVVRYIV